MSDETRDTTSDPKSRRRAMILRIAGLALIALSLALNERFFENYVFMKPTKWLEVMAGLLHRLQAIGIAAGLMLFFFRWTSAAWRWFRGTRLGRLLVAAPDWRCAPALVLFAAVETMYWAAACWCDQIPLWLPLTLVAWLHGLAMSSLLLLLATVVLTKLLQFRYMPLVSVLAWGAAIAADTLLFWYGNTRFEAKYVGMVTTDSLPGFINAGTVLFALAVFGLCLAAGFLLIRPVAAMTWASCLRIIVLLGVVFVVDLPFRTFSITMLTATRAHTAAVGVVLNHYARLNYIGQDSVLNACVEMIPRPRLGEITSLAPFEEAISHYDLPLGRQNYKPLETKPFRRVVVVFCESLSSFFLKSCNPKLPETATPFLDSVGDSNLLMRNYRTSSQPTTEGLAVTFCSHPNPEVLLATGLPQSAIKILRDNGWRTAFFSSATKYFDNKSRHFANAGIQNFFGAEELSEKPQDAKYRIDWGMCDRILYRHAKEYLAKHRDEQVFMVVEGADTHVPDGRTNYNGLEYPETPKWIERQRLSGFLRSVFRLDHDLKTFVDDLKKEKLLDDDTLLIVTADHCFPASPILNSLPGTSNSAFERIPLFMISTRALPPVDRNRPTSQLDFGPSLLHLQGLPVPQGSWGKSMFDPRPNAAPFVGIFRHNVTLESPRINETFELYHPETRLQKELGVLLRVYLK